MSTTFLLAPASASEPQRSDTTAPAIPSLNLLPFSLGSSSRPYTSSSANVSAHFQPRPAPAGIIGVEEGKTIAAFRGRQLVGQHVKVPRGYKGWLLRTDTVEKARIASGMGQDHQAGQASNGEAARMGDIASAGASTSRARSTRMQNGSNGAGESSGTQDDDDDLSLKRSPRRSGITALKQRVRGAGQTALARPKRAMAKATKKRVRLDSDDEDDEAPLPVAPTSAITPKKRPGPPLVTPTRQSPRLARTPQGVLPDITLHEATPLKSPLPPAPAHLKLKKAGRADFVIGQSIMEVDTEDLPNGRSGTAGRDAIKAEAEGDVQDDTDTEDISTTASAQSSFGAAGSTFSVIPSPATENDPPAFQIESAAPPPSAIDDKATPLEQEYRVKTLDIDGPVRVLQPTSAFAGFTLWTPDTALAGYVEPSLPTLASEAAAQSVSNGDAKNAADEPGAADVKAEQEETGPKIRPGWWANGGAGEGGDGIVRALGEFIGLVEMVSIHPTFSLHWGSRRYADISDQ